MNYLTLIADIVASKQIPNRAVFQQGLQSTLDEINTRSLNSIVSPFTITLGDEFQAVYKNATTLFGDIFSILSWAHPWQIRFSMACGPLTTEINRKQSIGMDGPAFVVARHQLEQQKKEQRTLIAVNLPNKEKTELINAFLGAMCNLSDMWNANAITVFSMVLRGYEPAEIAATMKLSLGTTYKHIREKHMTAYAADMRTVSKTVDDEIVTEN